VCVSRGRFHDIGETTAQHMYVRTSVMDAGSIQDEFL